MCGGDRLVPMHSYKFLSRRNFMSKVFLLPYGVGGILNPLHRGSRDTLLSVSDGLSRPSTAKQQVKLALIGAMDRIEAMRPWLSPRVSSTLWIIQDFINHRNRRASPKPTLVVQVGIVAECVSRTYQDGECQLPGVLTRTNQYE